MFLTKDSGVKINGNLDEMKAQLVKLDSDLANHQRAFDKHEMLDEQRFSGIVADTKEYRTENTQQHDAIKTQLQMFGNRLSWIVGIGVAVITLIQLVLSSGVKISF